MGCKVTWYLMEHLVEHISNMVSRWHFGAAWTRSAQSRIWSVKRDLRQLRRGYRMWVICG